MAKSEILDARRIEVDVAERRAEHGRIATQRERRLELDKLARSHEDHARQVDGSLSARKQILDELTVVRNKVHDKMLATRAKGTHGVGAADRALARAGKRALDANVEADRWQANAAREHARQRQTLTAEQAHLNKVRWEMDKRVAAAQDRGSERVSVAQELLEEASMDFEQIRLRHAEQVAEQVAHADRSLHLHVAASRVAQRQRAAEVRDAAAQSATSQKSSVFDVHKSQEDAARKVAAAKEHLDHQRADCEGDIYTDIVCAAQARKIASSLKQQEETDRHSALVKLDARVDFTEMLAQRKAANFDEEKKITRSRNEQMEKRSTAFVAAAQSRSGFEASKSIQRANEAKVDLAKLQGHCAGYIRSLMDQWEDAKRVNDCKVEAAIVRTESLQRFCDETIREVQRQWENRLVRSERFAEEKKGSLQQKVAEINDMSESRVDMIQRQASDWRKHAEALLADWQNHIEETRGECNERVRIEAETSSEKVRLARARHAERLELAAKRVAEAEERRDNARMEHDAVVARVRGSAVEARRRGLDTIACVIEPEEAADVGEEKYYHASSAQSAFMATASTAVPSVAPLRDTWGSFGISQDFGYTDQSPC
eukprot:TRINITY_DN42828_c0_g1_i1.p1 TRINITY_DN42828_c0_g1~~TRINITY_DN42828_c0_g1_i1.p1  ORF type:complete len:603 (-),score=150.44 TRINITY_DN42828_c0_g1_i1:84-1892(-)